MSTLVQGNLGPQALPRKGGGSVTCKGQSGDVLASRSRTVCACVCARVGVCEHNPLTTYKSLSACRAHNTGGGSSPAMVCKHCRRRRDRHKARLKDTLSERPSAQTTIYSGEDADSVLGPPGPGEKGGVAAKTGADTAAPPGVQGPHWSEFKARGSGDAGERRCCRCGPSLEQWVSPKRVYTAGKSKCVIP